MVSGMRSENTKYPIVYMVMINSPEEEKQADVFISSVRSFGGQYSNAPIILVVADSTKTRGTLLAGKVQKTVIVDINEKLRTFPFSDKVYACAQVEELVADTADWLVWANPDIIELVPPIEITTDTSAWAALRPVHVQNVGCPAEDSIPEFWKTIYDVSGLQTGKIWTVESLVDKKKIRGYFNSGCMAFDPSRGILRAWKDAFEKLLTDSIRYAFYSSSDPYAVFCHQAVLSAVVMAKIDKKNITILPLPYGYPLGFQEDPNFIDKVHSLSDLVMVITGGYNNLEKIEITEPYKSWLETHVKR